MKKYQVKAFTILEVTITMLIAAILIGITYTSYIIVSKSYLSFTAKNKDMLALERLEEWLSKDFDRAEFIQKDTAGIVIKKTDSTLIKYQFEPDFIVRTSVKTDTFNIKNGAFVTSFEGRGVDQSDPSKELNRLDELAITFLYKDESFSYHYHKQYSSANLIFRNPDAIH